MYFAPPGLSPKNPCLFRAALFCEHLKSEQKNIHSVSDRSSFYWEGEIKDKTQKPSEERLWGTQAERDPFTSVFLLSQ